MRDPNRPLFISTSRFVCSLDPASGRELWRTQLPRAAQLVSLLFSDGRLFAGGAGNVYAIDPATGKILWNNGLPGTGYGPVMITREGDDSQQETAIAAALAAEAAQAASDSSS